MLSGFTLLFLASFAQADEACETFVATTLDQMFSPVNRTPERVDPELRGLVQTNVDSLSIARFTLGKYAGRVNADDLAKYSKSLDAYFLEIIHEYINGGEHLSADVLRSFDRNHRDRIVETVIHKRALEDISVTWRVMRAGELHQVLDLAIERNGNKIWLAIELRAQVLDLYERSNGDLDVVIHRLGFG